MALYVVEIVNQATGEEGKVVLVANSGSAAQAEARRLGLTHSTVVRQLKGGGSVLSTLFSPAMIAAAALLAIGAIAGIAVGLGVSTSFDKSVKQEKPQSSLLDSGSKPFPPLIALGDGKALTIARDKWGKNYFAIIGSDGRAQYAMYSFDSGFVAPGSP